MTTTRRTPSSTKKKATGTPERANYNWQIDKEQSYQKFVRGLELFVVALNDSTCKIERTAFYEALQDRKKKLTQNLDAEFSATEIESNHFDGVGRFNITISNAQSESLVSISCTLEAHVHASTPFPKEFVERFAQSELRLVLTPYARSFIADAAARMAIPPVTIPFSTR